MTIKLQQANSLELEQPTMKNHIEYCLRLLDINEQYHPHIKDDAATFRNIVRVLDYVPFSDQPQDKMDAISKRFHSELQQSLLNIYEECFSVSTLVTSSAIPGPLATNCGNIHKCNDDNTQEMDIDGTISRSPCATPLDRCEVKQIDKDNSGSPKRNNETKTNAANEIIVDFGAENKHLEVKDNCQISKGDDAMISSFSSRTTQSTESISHGREESYSSRLQDTHLVGLGDWGIIEKIDKLVAAYDPEANESTWTSTPTNNEYSYFGKDQQIPKGIEAIVVDTSVTKIDYNAFYGCKALTAIDIPPNVMEIGEGAFEKCSSLRTVALSTYGGLQRIGGDAFSKCKSLKYISIPPTVEEIGEGAFQLCSRLTRVDLSGDGKLTILDKFTFCECKALESISLPPSLKEIGRGAFYGCLSLANVNLSNPHPHHSGSLKRIGAYAFAHCEALLSIDVPSTVEEIGDGAFYCCGALAAIALPQDGILRYIGFDAFSECTSLYRVAIPPRVEEIAPRAFRGCLAMKRVVLPPFGKLRRLGEKSFNECKSLQSIVLPPSLMTTGKDAFDAHVAVIQ